MTWPSRADWLEGAWYAAWVGELPDSYWQTMLQGLLERLEAWVAREQWPDFVRSPDGRRHLADQMFVRMSQASENFIPWVTEKLDIRGLRVLEIGCGTGSATAALARAGALVTGLDIFEPDLQVTQTRLAALGLSATLRCAPADWLATPETTRAQLDAPDGAPPYDLVVCYALLEHLLPAERLNLLEAVRELMLARRDACLIIAETPNRLAPYDWHSTQTGFPDILPDELAQAYLAKRLAPQHPWRGKLPAMLSAAGREDWFRSGRGASFHEFDIAFGLETIEVVQDGYSPCCDYIRHFRPELAYEAGLAEALARLDPPVPRGFCRPTLDLVLRLRDPAVQSGPPGDVLPSPEADPGEASAVFGSIYEKGWWGSAESRSGRGSELATTAVFRAALEAWLADHPDVATMVDAPCGDFNWMRALRFPRPVRYLGGEIVPALVADLTARFAGPDRGFRLIDIITDDIPPADLWLCRDALIHFPFALGARVTARFRASAIRYLMATTFPDARNDADIALGGYHKVNLALPPFGLGPPDQLLPDPAENNQSDRFIGIWSNPGVTPSSASPSA